MRIILTIISICIVSQVNGQLFSSFLPQVQIQVPGIGNVFGGQSSPSKNVLGAQVNFPGGGSAGSQIVLPNSTDNFLKTIQFLSGNFSQEISNRINDTLNQIQSFFGSTPLAPFIQAGVQAAQQFGGLGKAAENFLNPIQSFTQTIGQSAASGFGISNLFNGSSLLPNISNFLNPSILSNFLNQSSFIPNFNFQNIFGNQSVPDSLRQQIQNALQQFGNVANVSALQAITQIQKSFSELQNSSQAVINGISNVTNNNINSIQESLQNLSRNAQLCVNNSGISPLKAIESLRDEGIKCVQSKVQQGLDIVRNASANVQNAYANIQNVTAELQKCGSYSVNVSSNAIPAFQTARLGCYGSALLDINSDTMLLGFTMAERGADASNYLMSLKVEIFRCAAEANRKMFREMFEASRVIFDCMLANDN